VKCACHLVDHLVGIGDFDMVVLMLAGQTNSTMILELFLPTSGVRE